MDLKTTQWEPAGGWSVPLHHLAALDSPSTLVMAYGDAALADDPTPLRELAAHLPNAAIVGCSTAGEILADTVSDGTLTVAAARFGATRLQLVSERVDDVEDSFAIGSNLGRRLHCGDHELAAAFVLSDGLRVNGSALVSGLIEGTGRGIPVTGGLAGDGDRFGRTWVVVDGEPIAGHVTAVGLSGPSFKVSHGTRGGWDIFGPERRVTRSEGNVLYELDGKPALSLYKTYLGDRASGLPATALLFPLAVRVPGAGDRRIVRTILAIDEDTQSMTFAGDVPEGSLAQLMRANMDRLVDGAHDAGEEAHSGLTAGAWARPATPTLAVAISCVGRRLVLGRRTEDELEATLSGLPANTEMVGFYSYGEISPIAAGTCDLHNQTMTVTTFREAA